MMQGEKQVEKKGKYKQIALTIEVVDEISKFIDAHPELGYMSVPEFIRQSIRNFLSDLKKQY